MILNCNSCEKKFVVPDSAIGKEGRLVQCSSCGNKWKQFPITQIKKAQSISSPRKKITQTQPIQQKIQKPKKVKKSVVKKPREISLYSPEYLAKKHGIKINETKTQKKENKNTRDKVSFGFYSSVIVFIFFVISLSRILYFSQNFIITYLPMSEFYLNYFFENIRNIFEIWKSLIASY